MLSMFTRAEYSVTSWMGFTWTWAHLLWVLRKFLFLVPAQVAEIQYAKQCTLCIAYFSTEGYTYKLPELHNFPVIAWTSLLENEVVLGV